MEARQSWAEVRQPMEQQVLDQTKPMMDLGEILSYCALIQN
jgi:hypothetical protein